MEENQNKMSEMEKSAAATEHLMKELRAHNAQLTEDYESRLQSVYNEHCGIEDSISKKYENEVERMREEHEASMSEVMRGHDQLEVDKRDLEGQLEVLRKTVSEMQLSLSELTSFNDEAQKLARYITDTYHQVVTSDVVTSDLTQSDSELDWHVVQSQFTEVMSHLQKSVHEMREAKDKELEQHRTIVESIYIEHSEQVHTLRRNHSAELDQLKCDSDRTVKELMMKHEADMNELQTQLTGHLNDIASLKQDVENVHSKYQHDIEELTTSNDKELSVMRQSCESSRLDVENIKYQHAVEVEQLQRELNDSNQRHAAESAEMRQQHSSQVSELITKHHEETNNLKREIEELRHAKVTGQGEMKVTEQGQIEVTEITDQLGEENKHEAGIEDVEQRHEPEEPCRNGVVETQQCEDVHAECQKTVDDLTARHRESVEVLKTSYEKKILELTARLSELPEEGDNEMELSLLLEDYLPVQRHEEIVDQLRTALRTVSSSLSVCLSVCLSVYCHVLAYVSFCSASKRKSKFNVPPRATRPIRLA